MAMQKHTPGPWTCKAAHECDDPKCPGNVNRRKLKVFEELLEACKDLLYVPDVIANAPGAIIGEIRRDAEARARAAIAKAEERKEEP